MTDLPVIQPKPGDTLEVQGLTMPSPNGPMAVLLFDYGFSGHKIVMTAESAEQMADALPAILREAAAMTRRARLGLILPAMDSKLPPPPNGQRPT